MTRKSPFPKRSNIPPEVRKAVRDRDQCCRLCGRSGSRSNPLTIHHILFHQIHLALLERGIDRNRPEYLTLLCQQCHQAFHDYFQKHFG